MGTVGLSCGMRFHSAPFLSPIGRFVHYYNGKKININKIVTIRMVFDKITEIELLREINTDRKTVDSAKAAV